MTTALAVLNRRVAQCPNAVYRLAADGHLKNAALADGNLNRTICHVDTGSRPRPDKDFNCCALQQAHCRFTFPWGDTGLTTLAEVVLQEQCIESVHLQPPGVKGCHEIGLFDGSQLPACCRRLGVWGNVNAIRCQQAFVVELRLGLLRDVTRWINGEILAKSSPLRRAAAGDALSSDQEIP